MNLGLHYYLIVVKIKLMMSVICAYVLNMVGDYMHVLQTKKSGRLGHVTTLSRIGQVG